MLFSQLILRQICISRRPRPSDLGKDADEIHVARPESH
jgi:hypothetical protein